MPLTTYQQAGPGETREEAAFQSTLWSQVRAAGQGDGPGAHQALERLCQLYWPPIHAFLRRCGHDPQTAKDLTQGFFAYVLEHGLLQKATPERGRFRSFLLGSLKLFVSNEQARERALKRGGGLCVVSRDACPGDELETAEAAALSPERVFDRKWALTVLREAMQRLQREYQRAGLNDQFSLLQPYLTGEAEEHLTELAGHLGKSAGATRVLVFRLRTRFRRLIRAVIADTVSNPVQVESELADLEEALREG